MLKNTNKYNQRNLFKFIIIYSLYLSFLLMNTKTFEFSSQKPIYQRKLDGGTIPDENIPTDSLSNQTDITFENDNSFARRDNPFFYLSGFYLIFVAMCVYIIAIINRSPINPTAKDELKSGILKFLYMANNGALLVSIIFISSVFEISGFAPFGLGIIIFTIGSLYYICNLKENLVVVFFDNNTTEELCCLPGLMIKLVRYTYECCRCEYYDIVETRVYYDGHVEQTTYCTSCICLIWNLYWLFVKIITTFFTIISYEIFLVLFLLFRLIAKAIYLNCCIKEENNENNGNEANEININGGGGVNVIDNNNNPPINEPQNRLIINQNLRNGNNQFNNNQPQIDSYRFPSEEGIINSSQINVTNGRNNNQNYISNEPYPLPSYNDINNNNNLRNENMNNENEQGYQIGNVNTINNEENKENNDESISSNNQNQINKPSSDIDNHSNDNGNAPAPIHASPDENLQNNNVNCNDYGEN